MGEEHRVEIVAGLTSWRKEEGKRILNKDRKNIPDKNWLIYHSP